MLALLPAAVPRTIRQCVQWLGPRKTPAIALVGAITFMVLLIAGGSKMSAQTVLFDVALHPSQATEVERALLLWNEPFTTDAQHSQVYVPASHRRDILLRLTLAGLPHRYVPTTADVLEQPPSAFAPQAFVDDQRRAGIEGDLVSSLRRMTGISDATVVIAPAIADPLAEDASRAPASASVQLFTQPGITLTQNQIGGIKRFVAASYPGLSAEHVIVMDSLGVDANASASPEQALAKEAHLQNSIQSALDAVFGPGATVVRVTMRTADEERSSQRTLVTPHGLLEAERGTERGTESGKSFTKERSHTRYAYDTIVETRSARADALAKLSVAVFVDAQTVALSQSKLITDVVRAAAGADLTGDQVVVAALPFRKQSVPTHSSAAKLFGVRFAILGVIVAAAVIVWFAFFVHHAPAASPEDRAAHALQATLQNELPQTAAYVLGSLPASVRERVLRAYEPGQRQEIIGYLDGRTRA